MRTERCYTEGEGAGSKSYSEYEQISIETYLSSFVSGFKLGAEIPLLLEKYAHTVLLIQSEVSSDMMQSQDTKFETIATGLEVPTKEDAPVQVCFTHSLLSFRAHVRTLLDCPFLSSRLT